MTNKLVEEGSADMTAELGGETRELGEFPPIVEFVKVGGYVVGDYRGHGVVQMRRGPATVHYLSVVSFRDCEFKVRKKSVKLSVGDVVSLSGKVLDSSLKDVVEGARVGIQYKGLGDAKNGNNAPKLFSVQAVK